MPLAPAGALALGLCAVPMGAGASPIFSSNTPGLTTFTAPNTGVYIIGVKGAQGGACGKTKGGSGGSAQGAFALTAGETLTIGIGASGLSATTGGGGGGGTTVYDPFNTLLLAAGGGGGASEGPPPSTTGVAGGDGGSGGTGPGVYDGGPGATPGTGGSGGSSAIAPAALDPVLISGDEAGPGDIVISEETVPEPTTFAIFASSFACLGLVRRRRRATRTRTRTRAAARSSPPANPEDAP